MAMKFAKTEYGMVEGVSGWDPTVRVFKGIPYAAPPVGELRWREPQPHEPWEGVYKAFEFPDIFPQRESVITDRTGAVMNEDALYLNVWTCAESPDEKLPVLFYTHGGGYNTGCGHYQSYDGEAMAKQGVIMVTYNYRINIFGYLCHPELKAESPHNSTGNYGVMDQVFALQWVKRNIAAFGGDPDNITAMGLSAGAGSTRVLLNCPLAKDLIARAATMSVGGHLKSPDYIPTDGIKSEDCYVDLKKIFGVDTIAEARKIEGNELFRRFLENTKDSPRGAVSFRPTVDGYTIPDNMGVLQEAGYHPDIQYLIGCSADELSFMGRRSSNPDDVRAKGALVYSGEDLEEYVNVYMADETEAIKKAGYRAAAEHSRAAAVGFCELQQDLGRKAPYLYLMARKVPGDPSGAYHGSDLYYHFKTFTKSWQPWEGVDFELSNITSKMWANYCKNGDPNGEGLPLWVPYTDETPYTMVLDERPGMQIIEETPIVKFLTGYTRKVRKQK